MSAVPDHGAESAWLRAMPERIAVACDAPDALAQVLRHTEALLGPPA